MADPGDTQDGTEREGLDTEAIAAPREPEWGDVDLPDWLSYWADDVCEKAPYPDHGYAPTQRVMGYVRWLEARVFVDYNDTDEELAMATARIKDLEAEWADKLDFIEAALGRAEAERDQWKRSAETGDRVEFWREEAAAAEAELKRRDFDIQGAVALHQGELMRLRAQVREARAAGFMFDVGTGMTEVKRDPQPGLPPETTEAFQRMRDRGQAGRGEFIG